MDRAKIGIKGIQIKYHHRAWLEMINSRHIIDPKKKRGMRVLHLLVHGPYAISKA